MLMPSYHSISLDLLPEYRRCLALSPQKTSDYSATNLFCWADIYGLEWHCDGQCVHIRQTKPHPINWAPVGPWDRIDWAGHPALNPGTSYVRVPELLKDIWARSLPEGALSVSEARGQWDYVYLVQELIDLKGKKFIDKRNHLNYFKRSFDFKYQPIVPELLEKVRCMQCKWLCWNECPDSPSLVAESSAINRVLDNWDHLPDLMGGLVTIDNQVVAYTVAEPLDNENLLIHFEKGDHTVRGAYQAINQLFLEHQGKDFIYVNREQDLDEAGLRKAKLSYNPDRFLKKFAVDVK